MIGIIKRILKRKDRGKPRIPDIDLKMLQENIQSQSRPSLEKKLFNLTASYNISKEISEAADLESVLNLLVDRIAQVMSVEIVSFMLLSKNKSELIVRLAKGLDKEIVKTAKVKLGEGISGWVAQTGKPLLIKDISKDSRFLKRNDKYHNNSLLSVPLKIKDNVIGVINVNNKIAKDVFDEKDLDLLQIIADLSACVVANAGLREDIKELDKLRSNFIANVSHELRTPISAIKESVSLVLEELVGKITDKQRRLLSLATKNTERLSRLIDGLLDFAKQEAESRKMRRTLFDIGKTAESIVETLRPLASQKKIALVQHLPRERIEIWGDEDKISQVLTNFIDNAIKYNKPKGKVEVSLESVDSAVKICISDTGVGISEENLDKIFDRFQRIGGVFEAKTKGSGLGLAITKDIVDLHGGNIAVESRVGEGSKFTVILPKNLRLLR